MLRMVYPRRPQSGHLICYLNRTYHVLLTLPQIRLDRSNLPCQALGPSRPAASHRPQHLLPSGRRRDGFRTHSFSATRLLGPTCWRSVEQLSIGCFRKFAALMPHARILGNVRIGPTLVPGFGRKD